MKTTHVPRIPVLLLLSAALAWDGAALHGQEVQPRPTAKLGPALLDAYVFLALPVYLFGLAFLTDCIEKGVYPPVGHTEVSSYRSVRRGGHTDIRADRNSPNLLRSHRPRGVGPEHTSS